MNEASDYEKRNEENRARISPEGTPLESRRDLPMYECKLLSSVKKRSINKLVIHGMKTHREQSLKACPQLGPALTIRQGLKRTSPKRILSEGFIVSQAPQAAETQVDEGHGTFGSLRQSTDFLLRKERRNIERSDKNKSRNALNQSILISCFRQVAKQLSQE
ncbi:hypothetical protein V3C99_015488 [Haemonchus contortus]|uniref:Uncharacterized protein n=1 Tax=Haemonchus contortus TaxID=6289 RepID=A0A7I4YV12_HAECO